MQNKINSDAKVMETDCQPAVLLPPALISTFDFQGFLLREMELEQDDTPGDTPWKNSEQEQPDFGTLWIEKNYLY